MIEELLELNQLHERDEFDTLTYNEPMDQAGAQNFFANTKNFNKASFALSSNRKDFNFKPSKGSSLRVRDKLAKTNKNFHPFFHQKDSLGSKIASKIEQPSKKPHSKSFKLGSKKLNKGLKRLRTNKNFVKKPLIQRTDFEQGDKLRPENAREERFDVEPGFFYVKGFWKKKVSLNTLEFQAERWVRSIKLKEGQGERWLMADGELVAQVRDSAESRNQVKKRSGLEVIASPFDYFKSKRDVDEYLW